MESWFHHYTQLIQEYFYSLKWNSFCEAEFQKIWRMMSLLVKSIFILKMNEKLQ